ncbi:helix-turn-helix domain-containing protein [Novosphingobium resinovorum]|uniref:helix-turn-helix domain-containing protein n=1 Tax=Novosphingobium TaxID=165696 RepID=UPI001B3C78D6|nr:MULTISPECIES: helix-turn-helix domain-containing protein [Novosphingobium]MBF7009973.1 helix-turn-helix domain-containing protein [Novosphingobium sp. HR1a]WJM27997.1 helix-turn-helix domain-containing protein [Novosphingobium resinovorum]
MSKEIFCTRGQLIIGQPRLYEDCGLENIWLVDGFSVTNRRGEELIHVEDIEGLHKAIALHLVRFRKALSGREIKFIRRAIDMTQGELAHRLGTGVQTVARWEKDKVNIPGPEDRLLRINTLLAISEPATFAQLILEMPSNLADLDEGPDRPVSFTHNHAHDHKWVEAVLEAA